MSDFRTNGQIRPLFWTISIPPLTGSRGLLVTDAAFFPPSMLPLYASPDLVRLIFLTNCQLLCIVF